ncbi:uncharacterized protein B0T15DRAFT_549165 [Chaetomium strumarium]|uniref:Uncharacterized protein n=1 Tax=Chaetomium strumarium TaxID=1170767 RepID=A0AAJ0M7B5_9PEZI|nr:hypothetical protein B0T15DRAFT_549165 [Chaetomium strumarium]
MDSHILVSLCLRGLSWFSSAFSLGASHGFEELPVRPSQSWSLRDVPFPISNSTASVDLSVEESGDDGKLLRVFIALLYTVLPLSQGRTDDLPSTGFPTAVLQWRSRKAGQSPWCRTVSYDFMGEESTDEPPGKGVHRHNDPNFQLLCARTVRSFTLEHPDNANVKASMVCEAYRFQLAPNRLRNVLTNKKLIFILQVYHAHVNVYTSFLTALEVHYASARLRRLSSSHQSKLRQWSFNAIVEDCHFYQRLINAASELTLTTESLLAVAISLEEPGKEDPQADTARRGAERLLLLSLSRDMSQSKNVQILTLLATIFLPLSLSAGILSMQARFKDLGQLLYDFFGVVVLLAAAVALLVFAMLVFSLLNEVESTLHHKVLYVRLVRPLLLVTLVSVGLDFGALVLSSFVVGMFKDVRLGASILGYGTAVAVGLPTTVLVATALIYYSSKVVYHSSTKKEKERKKERKNEQDPESNVGQQGAEGEGEKVEPLVREEPAVGSEGGLPL